MSVKEGRDYLYLIWKSEKNRRQYIIGELSKNSHFEFRYCGEVQKAKEQGFKLLVPFPDEEYIYESKTLFPAFESRLPDKRRKDMAKILKKYDMDEFEPYQLLKRSGGRLPIDNLYFIDPILDSNKSFRRIFYLAGVRHYLGCDGTDCVRSLNISVGDELFFEIEPENCKDNKAVKVVNAQKIQVGYIPRYYSSSLFSLINEGRNIQCIVTFVDKDKCCDECVKVQLEVKE